MTLNLISCSNTARGAAMMTPEPHRKAVWGALDQLDPFLEAMDWIQEEGHTIRRDDYPTGGDDFEERWAVVSHWMAEPKERVLAYGPNLAAAVIKAMTDPFDV